MSKCLKFLTQNLIAVAAGGILPLAFSPFGYYPFAFISPAILLFFWKNNSTRMAVLNGFLFGVGFFGVGISWIYIGLHTQGIILATLLTTALITILSLFPAFQGLFLNYFFTKSNATKLLVMFPISWVVLEYLRTELFTGFPWLLLGYSQIDSPLRNIAPILGVYGISLALAFTSGTIIYWLHTKNKIIRFILICTLLSLWLGPNILNKTQWIKPEGEAIQVTIIQGNISPDEKWSSEELHGILNIYAQLTQQHPDSKIIVWPESAIPIFQESIPNFIQYISAFAIKHNTTIITGVPITRADQFYNGIISFGQNHNLYLKRHLVPFGEYLPLKNLSTLDKLIRKKIAYPMSDLDSGYEKQCPFIVNNISIAPLICYETAYPNLLLDYLPQAQLLVTLSDDGWFKKSKALAQHLEIARMRSLETGRYQLMSTNSGITAIIDAQGKIIAQAPSFQQFALTHKIQPMNGSTPYVQLMKYLQLQFIHFQNKYHLAQHPRLLCDPNIY